MLHKTSRSFNVYFLLDVNGQMIRDLVRKHPMLHLHHLPLGQCLDQITRQIGEVRWINYWTRNEEAEEEETTLSLSSLF